MMDAMNKGIDVGLQEHKRGEELGEGRLFKQVLLVLLQMPSMLLGKWLLRNVQEFKGRSSRQKRCKDTDAS